MHPWPRLPLWGGEQKCHASAGVFLGKFGRDSVTAGASEDRTGTVSERTGKQVRVGSRDSAPPPGTAFTLPSHAHAQSSQSWGSPLEGKGLKEGNRVPSRIG